MSRHGLGGETRTEWCDFTEASGYEGASRLLRGRRPPTAIVGLNDVACIGALSAADERDNRARPAFARRLRQHEPRRHAPHLAHHGGPYERGGGAGGSEDVVGTHPSPGPPGRRALDRATPGASGKFRSPRASPGHQPCPSFGSVSVPHRSMQLRHIGVQQEPVSPPKLPHAGLRLAAPARTGFRPPGSFDGTKRLWLTPAKHRGQPVT